MSRLLHADADALRELPLDGFPVIEDFAVTVTGDDSDEGGRHVELRSAAHGRLGGFPAWDHADRDLRHFTPYDVPLGRIDEPYDDRDDDWRILIFEHDGYVYVLEGDSPSSNDFPRFFRVVTGRYVQAWAALIDFYNPITPLDETEDQ